MRSPGDSAGRSGPGGIPLARRGHPGHPPALLRQRSDRVSGRNTEKGPLNVFNWSDYINPAVVKKFEKAYNVKVKITTFENEEEALAKLTSGQRELRRLVRDRRLPLAHRRRQAHPAGQPLLPPEPEERVAAAAEPVLRRALALLGAVHRLHDRHRVAEGQGARRRRPRSRTATTRSGTHRSTPGKVAILDDQREALGMALRHRGVGNVNTENAKLVQAAANDLKQLTKTVNVKTNTTQYTDVPTGATWLGQAWSGDMAGRDVLHAEERARQRDRLLAAGEERGRRQRHDHGAARREEPGARAPLPELPARQRARPRELLVARLHAAAQRRSTRTR